MKKILVAFAILLLAVTLSGCAQAPVERDINFPWTIKLIVQYKVDSETAQKEIDFDDTVTLNVVIQENLFLREYTLSFPNPWVAVKASPERFKVINDLLPSGATDIDYQFKIILPTRISQANDRIRYVNEIIEHLYYFKDTPETIVLIDREPKPPIWYAVGIGGTIIFMGVIYVVFTIIQRRKTVGKIMNPDVI